ncbi:MAG: TIGR03118 family protein [Chitinophagaceae bacterium]
MKKINLSPCASWQGLSLLFLSVIILTTACQKGKDLPVTKEDESVTQELSRGHHDDDVKGIKTFIQVNLVANNNNYGATGIIDKALINGWGIAFSPTGVPWIASQGGGVSAVYNSEGTATILGPVNIPSPGGPIGGNPTGVIFNPVATDFVIPSANAQPATGARFIFVGVDGVVSGWNGTRGVNAFAQFNNVATSAYTGLAIASSAGSNYLYAADFRAGKIAVWDKAWTPVSMKFKDPWLPWGYSPFNIQTIGEYLYVTYAKVGPDGRSQAGNGKGFVSIFRTDGSFVKRFASKDELNAPWGVAMAPATFFSEAIRYDNDDHYGDDHHGYGHYNHDKNREPQPAILIGNFGDGRINVYSLRGKFLGQLKSNKRIIKIDGLWAITFPPTTSTNNPNRLYFAAGPNHETDGLFGYIIKDSTVVHGGGDNGHY